MLGVSAVASSASLRQNTPRKRTPQANRAMPSPVFLPNSIGVFGHQPRRDEDAAHQNDHDGQRMEDRLARASLQ